MDISNAFMKTDSISQLTQQTEGQMRKHLCCTAV